MARKKKTELPPSGVPTGVSVMGVSGEKPKNSPSRSRGCLKWAFLLLIGACAFSYLYTYPRKPPTAALPTAALLPTTTSLEAKPIEPTELPTLNIADTAEVQAVAAIPSVLPTETPDTLSLTVAIVFTQVIQDMTATAAAPTATAVTMPSATITDTPFPTVVPTATPLPYQTLPLSAPIEMRSNGTPLVWTVDAAQAWTTNEWYGTAHSLVLVGDMANPSSAEACIRAGDLNLRLDGMLHSTNPTSVMDGMKAVLNLDYIGGFSGICVQPGAVRRVFMAFDGESILNKTDWKTFEVHFENKLYTIIDRSGTTAAIANPTTTQPASTTSNTRRETRLIQSSANVRTCPRRDDACLLGVQLQPGTSIMVTGTEQGDSVSQSTLWYVIEYQGKTAYVHSSLVAAAGVTSLPSAPASNQSANPPVVVIPSNSQSVVPVQSGRVWDCSGDHYNCSSFNTRAELDSYWQACPGDPSRLDAEGDGKYCESVR